MNTSWIEWTWLAIAFVAWVVKLFLVASARANCRHPYGTALQIFMARSVYYHMGHMFIAFTICLVAAAWAVLHTPPPPPIHETQSFMIAMFFLVLNLVLLVHAIMVARWWNRLEDGRYNKGDTSEDIGDTMKSSVVTVATTVTSEPPGPEIKVVKDKA